MVVLDTTISRFVWCFMFLIGVFFCSVCGFDDAVFFDYPIDYKRLRSAFVKKLNFRTQHKKQTQKATFIRIPILQRLIVAMCTLPSMRKSWH